MSPCLCFAWAGGPSPSKASSSTAPAAATRHRVELVVGGERFSTSRATLTRYPGSVVAQLLDDGPWEDGAYFLDRPGQHFNLVLSFLRDGPENWRPPSSPEIREALLIEARCLRLPELASALEALPSAAAGAGGRPPATSPAAAAKSNASASDSGSEVFMGAPWPHNESERLLYLKRLQVSGHSESDVRFDSITAIVAALLKAPISAISLVTEDVLLFKSAVGLDDKTCPRNLGFCAYTLLPEDPSTAAVFTIEDLTRDSRTADNPLVRGEAALRFYAGCPLVTSNGIRLGALCVIDRRPRNLPPEEAQLLVNFGTIAALELERSHLQHGAGGMSRQLSTMSQASHSARQESHDTIDLSSAVRCDSGSARLQRMQEAVHEVVVLVWARPDCANWLVVYANDQWTELTGVRVRPSCTLPGKAEFFFGDLEAPCDKRCLWDYLQLSTIDSRQRKNMFECVARATEPNTQPQMFAVSATLAQSDVQVSCRFSPAELPLDAGASAVRPSSQGLATGQKLALAGFPAGHLYFVVMTRHDPDQLNSGRGVRRLPSEKRKVPQSPFEDVRAVSLVGSGSFGKVYLGRWGGINVAVKVISSNAQDKSKSNLEAVLSASISHPNLVQTFKHGERIATEDETGAAAKKNQIETWIVQEWCDGGTLRGICTHPRADVAGLAEAMDIGAEIVSAVSYLHDQGLVHGDLTTNNILLKTMPTPKGYICKVGDFGLARIFNDKEEVVTVSLGTVSHMPPELFSEDVDTFTLTPKVDVYSFARILFEVLTGQRPFDGLSPAQIVMQVARGACMKLTISVPAALEAMYLRCLAPNPAQRPRCAELLDVMAMIKQIVTKPA